MKKKHLLYSMALVAGLAACTQDEFVDPVNPEASNVKNDFSQYVGAPFEGNITFDKGGVQTRMDLDGNSNFQWKKDDQVGLVWTNYDAISLALSGYKLSSETDEALEALEEAKIVTYNTNNLYDKPNGFKYNSYEYENAVKAGDAIPVDESYVWSLWPNAWKTASNTRMTYDGGKWFMTDGQVYKGMYLAYYPYDASRQSTSKFTVAQNAEQYQNATVAGEDNAAETIANHIVSTEPGVGMVWLSRNLGEVTNANGNSLQHSSFLYDLTAQDVESGTSGEVNINMYPFSDILDLRIAVDAGNVSADVAKKIEIESVQLIADDAVFPTTAAFQLNAWGSNSVRNGVYGIPRAGREDPLLYTWNVGGTNKTKYTEGNLVETVTNTINNPAANNGAEQRVQLVLLPKYYANQDAALAADNQYSVKINTNYGYITIKENDATYPWQYKKANASGLWVNQTDEQRAQSYATVASDETKRLDYALTHIGERATRYIAFDADRLIFNSIYIDNTEELIEAIEKWNELGKTGNFTVILNKDKTLENLVWSDKSEAVTLDTYLLENPNQPKDKTITLGTADEAVQKFLAGGSKLIINSADADVNLSGTCAIDNENISFSKLVVLDGTLGVTDAATMEKGLTTSATSQVYVANEDDATLTVGATTTWEGEMWVYQAGTIKLADQKNANISNLGTLHINGKFNVGHTANFSNADDAEGKDKGIVKLYSYARVDGAKQTNSFINNSIMYYVDAPDTFNKTNIGYKNNGVVYAEITLANVANHRDSYLEDANSFGATHLVIGDGVTINGAEWNNMAAKNLGSFKFVELNGEITWNSFKGIQLKNAVFIVDGDVTFQGNNQESQLILKQFILADNAKLSVKAMKVAEEDVTIMNNNTTLNGYDNFSNFEHQPKFNGNGYHYIYSEAGDEMVDFKYKN